MAARMWVSKAAYHSLANRARQSPSVSRIATLHRIRVFGRGRSQFAVETLPRILLPREEGEKGRGRVAGGGPEKL